MRFLGNMFFLITSFKNMVVKFVGGSSVGTCSYVIIHFMYKVYSFSSVFGIRIVEKQLSIWYLFVFTVCWYCSGYEICTTICISVGYLEETILFPQLLSLHFTLTECKSIEEMFKRFVNNGFFFMAQKCQYWCI